MKNKILLFVATIVFTALQLNAQNNLPKGNLFIIGGGDRTLSLMQSLISTAQLSPKDYIAVLPMSGEEPDSSYFYIKEDIQPACPNTLIANLNFTAETANNNTMLDSLKHAKLIFITGGDQTRFMKIVLHTPIYNAIHEAYQNGSTISGTSAGAAVMSKIMITGNQLKDTSYEATFDKLWDKNIEINEGLGLITNAIIDQHFVVRSRYNRLFSAIAAYPQMPCIGIDESTAIIVHQNKITVTGKSQVILMQHPKNVQVTKEGYIKFKDLQITFFTEGDSFTLQ